MSSLVNLLHIFVIVPLLYALYHYRKNLNMNICNAIIIISIIGFIYHWIKVSELPDDKKYMNWIYWLHIIVVFPLLFYVGRNCEKTERKYYELLLLVMFGALGYHTYNYFKYK